MTKSASFIHESAQFGDVDMPEHLVAPARRTVAANAKDPEDARQLLEMLGLIEPASQSAAAPVRCQRYCDGCKRPARNHGEDPGGWPGTVAIRARGLCGTCHHEARAAEKAAVNA